MFTISKNDRFQSIEINFSGKPSEAVRDVLKASRFRWNPSRGVWYGFADAEKIRASLTAAEMNEQNGPSAEQPTEKKPGKQDRIRIYWNGIRIDGGDLIRVFYGSYSDESITISAKDYSGDLPAEFFDVVNNSDIMTDYYEKDRATVRPENPFYKFFRFAMLKASARQNRTYCEKLRETLNSGRREPWPGHFDSLRDDLARREKLLAEFDAMEDPGQPTAEDVDEFFRMKSENERRAEEAKKEAEQKEDQRLRRVYLRKYGDARRLISETSKKYPITDGAPVVVVEWSEHPGIEDGEKMSLPAAEIVLGTLDMIQHETRETEAGSGWYHKTSFRIEWNSDTGEPCQYSGRYDLGDGEGGLIEHIRSFGEWERTHEMNGREKTNPEESNDILDFAAFLTDCVREA